MSEKGNNLIRFPEIKSETSEKRFPKMTLYKRLFFFFSLFFLYTCESEGNLPGGKRMLRKGYFVTVRGIMLLEHVTLYALMKL